MPSPGQIETVFKLGEEVAAAASGEGGLNLLRIVAPEVGLAESGDAIRRIVAASEAMQSGLSGVSKLATRINPESLLMDTKYARISAPAVLRAGGLPTYSSISFDTADNLGRIWNARRIPLAAVARVPLDPAEFTAYGSGTAVRSDGLILAARHTVRDVNNGPIWVKLFNQPGVPSFKVGILAEDKATDLVLLKPLSTLGRPIPHLTLGEFEDPSRLWKGTDVVSVGVQHQTITTGGTFTSAESVLGPGKFLDKATMHYAGEASVQNLRTTIAGEYGISGGATYNVGSNRYIGTLIGGADNQWTAVVPSDRAKQFIMRNWTR